MNKKIKVAIADDHSMIIDGIGNIINNEPDMNVLIKAYNGQELLDLLEDKEIEVVILDINMPVLDGVETAKIITEKYPAIKIIILSMHSTYDMVSKLLEIGVSGYLTKNQASLSLIHSIRAVYNGSKVYSEAVADCIVSNLQKPYVELSIPSDTDLTKRELEVLKCIAKEMTSPEIASNLRISESTVNAHRRNLISKLGVRSSMGLVRYAFENNIV